MTSKKHKTHGMSNTGVYNSYKRMMERTTNPNHPSYHKYGGAGIVVEEPAWLLPQPEGFLNFFKDLGHRPEGCTLDRIDNNKGYSKDNCKWSTKSEQQRNRNNLPARSDKGSQYRGVYHAPTAWAMKFDALKLSGGKTVNLSFETELEAATAFDNLYEKYFKVRPNSTERIIVYPKFKKIGYVAKKRNKFCVIANIDGKPVTIKGRFETRELAEDFLEEFNLDKYNNIEGVLWH